MGSYVHGSTFGGATLWLPPWRSPTCRQCGPDDLMQHVLDTEGYFADRLNDLAAGHPCVRGVRGTGFFYAIDICADRDSALDLSSSQRAGLQGGVLGSFVREEKMTIRPDDRGYTGLTISPPLVADTEVIDDLSERVDRVLTRVDTWLGGNR